VSPTICVELAHRRLRPPIISEELVSRATLDAENVPSYLDLIFVSRALKRIGDHATNIGGDSFWRDQAMDIST
jgi:PhoU domain